MYPFLLGSWQSLKKFLLSFCDKKAKKKRFIQSWARKRNRISLEVGYGKWGKERIYRASWCEDMGRDGLNQWWSGLFLSLFFSPLSLFYKLFLLSSGSFSVVCRGSYLPQLLVHTCLSPFSHFLLLSLLYAVPIFNQVFPGSLHSLFFFLPLPPLFFSYCFQSYDFKRLVPLAMPPQAHRKFRNFPLPHHYS